MATNVTRSLDRAMCLTLAGLLMLAPEREGRAACLAPGPTYYEELTKAERAFASEEFAAAGEAYERAYDSLAKRERGSEDGTDVVLASTQARRELFLADADAPESLRAAEALLDRHITDIQATRPERSTDDLEKQLASIRKLLRKFDSNETQAKVVASPAVATEVSTLRANDGGMTTDEEDMSPSGHPRDKQVGIGLTAAGAVLLAGGLVLIPVGAVNTKDINNTYDDRKNADYGGDCQPPGECASLDSWRHTELTKKATVPIALGAVAMGAGLALLIGGAVVLARSRKPKRTSVSPVRIPGGVGIAISGRF
jgi:hypothetical protein